MEVLRACRSGNLLQPHLTSSLLSFPPASPHHRTPHSYDNDIHLRLRWRCPLPHLQAPYQIPSHFASSSRSPLFVRIESRYPGSTPCRNHSTRQRPPILFPCILILFILYFRPQYRAVGNFPQPPTPSRTSRTSTPHPTRLVLGLAHTPCFSPLSPRVPTTLEETRDMIAAFIISGHTRRLSIHLIDDF